MQQPSALLAILLLSAAPVAQDPESSPDLSALRSRLAQELSGARLIGSATDDSRESGAPFEDEYRLGLVEHLEGDTWSFEWLLERGEATIPLRVKARVLFAGDTPVITVDGARIPLMGTYSARVVLHGGRYAGTWDGGDHGGHLWGRVLPGEVAKAEDEQAGVHWPSFRGAGARGTSAGFETPVRWDVPTGEGVRWSTPIAGLAHSSPAIHGDRLFLTSAARVDQEDAELLVGLYGSISPVEDEGPQELRVLCLEKGSGQVLWSRLAWVGVPAVKRHPKGSHAASSPATDGEHVLAMFGSEGLYCYDGEGQLLWTRDFGVLDSGFYMTPDAQWGFASSPVIHDGLALVQVDVNGDDFVCALDVESGDELWRTAREEVPTWSSPTVDVESGRRQVILNGYKHIGGYDLDSGAELWSLVGGGDIPVPTPVVVDDVVYITSAHGRMAPVYAIDAGARGSLSLEGEGTGLVWHQRRRGNYMQTPLVLDGLLYLCHDTGVLSCHDARSGQLHYRERLGDGGTGFTSSGVAADGKLYFSSEEGRVHVVRAGQDFELLEVNDLGEECMASAAISEGVLFFRTRSRLVAIGS